MLFLALFTAVAAFINFVLSLLPTLPPMPVEISNAAYAFIDILAQGVGILTAIYSAPILSAIMVLFIALFTFEHLYHLTIWLLRKLPISIH